MKVFLYSCESKLVRNRYVVKVFLNLNFPFFSNQRDGKFIVICTHRLPSILIISELDMLTIGFQNSSVGAILLSSTMNRTLSEL